MKINKILAAGVAATLAVTSLSAVASAEVKSIEFPMDYTVTNVKWNDVKIQWLGDNDYIGGAGYGAAATMKALVEPYIADAKSDLGANVTKGDGTGVGDFADVLAATKKAIIDDVTGGAGTVSDAIWGTGKGAGTSTAAWKVTTAEITPAILANAKNFTNAVITAETAAAAIVANTGKEENVYSAEKELGDFRTLVEKLIVADEALDNLIALQANAATATPAAITTLATNLDAAIVEAKGYLRKAEDALIGAPLLEDEELGGIQISTVPQLLSGTAGEVGAKYVKVTGAKLTIKGTKRGSTQNESWSGDFQQAYNTFNADHSGATKAEALYLAFAPKYVNRPAYINLNVFGTITDVEVDISYELQICKGGTAAKPVLETAEYYSENDYNANKKVLAKALRAATAIKVYDELDMPTETCDLAADDADWKTTYTALADPTTNLYKMYKALANSVLTEEKEDNSNSKVTKYAFVEQTQNNGQTIWRENVKPMSRTNAYYSQNQVYKTDGNQTYYDSGLGTNPNEFGGLASQVADFFNKQNNGQIEFHFIDPAKVTTWTSNGIPSTEVGLRTALAQTAFALFFNYEESTGSIQTIGTVDKDALTVTFDMEDVLADFGGLTKANLHDIYYGCNNGLTYGDPYKKTGYAVDKVTLRYDDAPAAVDPATDDDAAADDDDAAVVVADDDDDDDVVADDDDDDIAADDDIIEDDDDDDDDSGEIIADDDDDDDDVNNDVDYVDADDDANPGTGVGLAVIPAIVAGAALVVSKKRK